MLSKNAKKSLRNSSENIEKVCQLTEEEEEYDGDPSKIRNDYKYGASAFKLMLCVNTELKMDKGKIAAQCGHATLGAFKLAQKYCKSGLMNWEYLGQAKVAVKIDSLEKMLELEHKVLYYKITSIITI